VRAIIEGWRIPPQAPDESLRESLSRWAEMIGPEGLHQRLATLDPQAAEMIDYRNMRRTIRALEVILNTGERFSDLRKKQQCRYTPFIFGISCPREVLYQRIDQRIDQMIADGLVEEVQTLLQSGYQADLPTLSAIGYGEIIQYLNNQVSLEEAVTLIRRNTRIFVRRQANWFKPDDPRIHWVEAAEGMVDNMEEMIRRWLNGL
jgi:tRNA dimethylallyltransferase